MTTLRDHARARVAAIIEAGHADELARAWPPDVPGLKQDAHDEAALDLILAACSEVEGRHRLPFGDEDPRCDERLAELQHVLAELSTDAVMSQRYAYWILEAAEVDIDFRHPRTVEQVTRALTVAKLCRLDIATASRLLFDTNPDALAAPFDRTEGWLVQKIDTEQAERISARMTSDDQFGVAAESTQQESELIS